MRNIKFKTKYKYLRAIICFLLLIVFSIISFKKLNKSYSDFINIITIDFKNDNNTFILTNNLDYLINTYSFKEINEVYEEDTNNST